ncbi:MAG: hypothetical protein P4L40_05780 [Terracidiphilus sp.]|nr:hypothetical protein [Terracidiphilus sp.]
MNCRNSLVHFSFAWLCIGLTAMSAKPLIAQTAGDTLEVQCDGVLGKTRTGMTLIVKSATISSGHYFIAENLRDIPVTGSIHDGYIALSGTDKSEFDLRFKSNGSEHGQLLDFQNSVGLIGTRRINGKVENVDLSYLTMGQLSQGRRYAYTTDLSDAQFESIVRNWRSAVLAGHREEAAKYTHFPLRVNAHLRHRTIHTSAEFFNQWDRIFTPAYLARIKKDLPHDMLGESSSLLVGLGQGDVYFGDKGIEVLNLPD